MRSTQDPRSEGNPACWLPGVTPVPRMCPLEGRNESLHEHVAVVDMRRVGSDAESPVSRMTARTSRHRHRSEIDKRPETL